MALQRRARAFVPTDVSVGFLAVDQIDRVTYDRAQVRRAVFKIDHTRERVGKRGMVSPLA